jgi:hypothetical protein
VMVIFFFTVLGMQVRLCTLSICGIHVYYYIIHLLYLFPQLFGTIQITSIDDPNGSEINYYNNFSNFFRAFLVMIRYAISINFVMIVVDLSLSLSLSSPPLLLR